MSYLVDTNVLCEHLKPRPDPEVLEWLRDHQSELFISVVTVAEINRGIERLPEGKRRADFEKWLTRISKTMRGSILSFNRSVAHVWGQMQADLERNGRQIPAFDSIIAATGIRYQLTVVTRNTKDFEKSSVRILNPFS